MKDPTNLVTTTIFDRASRPVATYGPGSVSDFSGGTSPSGVPHTTIEYDEAMKGLGVTFWGNAGLEGKPAARSLGIPGVTSGAVDRNWGTASPVTGVNAGNWSSRHTGEIQMAAGNYGFNLVAGDGARLWIDDALVVDNWVASPLTENGAITVAAGRHRIRIDHYASSSTSELTLRWTPPSSSQAVVPGTALFPSYGLVTRTTDPDGLVSKTEYQDPALGAPTAEVADPAGLNLRTETTYEASGANKYFRRTARQLPKGPATATNYEYWPAASNHANPCINGGTAYDQVGMRKKATSPDPAGSQGPIVYQYRYDGSGRIVATQVVGDANWRCTSYDARGRVTLQSATDAKTTENDYSVVGEVTTTYTDSGGTVRTTIQKLDWIGRPDSYTDEHGVITRTTFDQASRPVDTFRTYPVAGIPLVEVALASYAYDTAGNVAGVTDHLSISARTASFSYDAAARLSTITRPNGVVTTNDYSATRGSLDKVTHSKVSEITSTAYTRSDAGRVSTETTPAFSRTFSYDGAGRLFKTVEGSVTRNYSFDANSNRCSQATSCDATYAYDDADRITASPFASGYGYDSHGNLETIASSGAVIGYDGWDHATSIKPDTATAATVETLAPSGRVIRRVEPVLNLPVVDTAFGYAGQGDSAAYSGPVVANLLVLLPLTITSYISGPGGLLNIDTGGAASWPLANGHGDIVGTTDAAGVYTANPVTDEFGVGAVPASRLGYLGSAERFSTGGSLKLIRMGVRLYDPALGRFLQVDPVEGGSANDYDYVNHDPVGTFDLDGKVAVRKWGANVAGHASRLAAGAALGYRVVRAKGVGVFKATATRVARFPAAAAGLEAGVAQGIFDGFGDQRLSLKQRVGRIALQSGIALVSTRVGLLATAACLGFAGCGIVVGVATSYGLNEWLAPAAADRFGLGSWEAP